MISKIAEVPREKLKELIEKNGDSLLQDPDRCEGLLKDHCGAHRREISALVGALEERVPLELKSSWQTAMTPEAMRARLVQRLEENRGLAPEVATWAVDAWSYALGVGLARQSDRVEHMGGAAAGAGLVGGVAAGEVLAADHSNKSIAERVASDRAGGAVELAGTATTGAALAHMTPKKAGMGAVGVIALSAVAFALFHHPTPNPPNPTPAPPQPVVVNPGPTKPTPDGAAGQGAGTIANGNAAGNGSGSQQTATALMQAGTGISIRLDRPVNSDDVNVGDLLPATVISPVTADGNVVIAAGAKARVRVASIDRSGQGGAEHLNLELADVSTAHGMVRLSAGSHMFNGAPARAEVGKRAGIGAAAGAVGGFVVGKIFHHGGAGAAAGAGTGAVAGAVTAKPGPVHIPSETLIHFRLAKPAQIAL